MLTAIKRKINKTPTENSSTLLREVDSLNKDIILTLLNSKFSGEGVFGIEQYSDNDFLDNFIFTPALERMEIGSVSHKQYNWFKSMKNLLCYDIELTKPTFLPIYSLNELTLLNDISLLANKDVSIFIQILFCKRTDNWRDSLINLYGDFLKGNDEPIENKFIRNMQSKLLKIINKNTHILRESIEEIEQKILDENGGYRTEIRVILQSHNHKRIRIVENEIESLLQEFDFFNEFKLNKTNWKKDFLNNLINREFSPESQNQILSFNELQSILISDSTIQTIKPQPQQEVTEVKPTPNVNNIPLHLLPIGEKKERHIDNELVTELPIALKKARAIKTNHIEILDVEMGATVQRITCKIPDNVVYSDIKSKHEDIKAVLGNEVSVIQGSQPNTVTFLIPCSEREIIYLKEMLEDESFLEFAKENALPFICGIDMHNKPVYKDLTKAPMLLIAGATGSGKSVMINALLITLILFKNPRELRLFLIDPKKVELIQYEGFAHVEKVVTDMNKAIHTLNELVIEMENRYEKFSKAKVKKIDGYNKHSKEKIPYIVCAIDEYNDLKMQHPEVEDLIERLGQKARAAGIHLIIATQRPDKEVMTGVVKTNLPSRIAFKLDNTNEYRTVFGTGIPYRNLLGLGDGVVKFVGQTEEFIRFQAPAITLDDEEEEKTYEKLKQFYKGEVVANIGVKENIDVVEEESINKLKRIIATTGECRVSKLRESMSMRINVVQELMQQLVEEGWLEKPESKSKGYQLIASDEELNKWREH